MKKIIFVSILLAAVCACTKENFSNQEVSDGLYPMTLTVEVGDSDVDEGTNADESKAWTYVNMKEMKFKFRWNGAKSETREELSAFDNHCTTFGGHKFVTLADPAPQNQKISISGEVCSEATGQIVFLHPYQKNHWDKTWNDTRFDFDTKYDVANNKITEIFIPYDYAKLDAGDDKNGTLTDSKLVRVGVLPSKESTDKLCLYNPLSGVYFQLTGSGTHKVTKIEIFGNNSEKLAGYCDIDVSTPNAPKVVFFPEPYLSKDSKTGAAKGHRVAYDLFLNSGGTELIDAQYIAALAPTNFTKGLTIKFTDNNGNVAFVSSSKALNIARDHIKNLGAFNVDALDWHFAMDLRFIPGAFLKDGNKSNPFNENIITSKNTVNTQHFTLKDGSSKVIEFKTYCPSDGLIEYVDGGYNFNGTGAYFEIPAIEGKVLKKIFLRVSATGGKNGQPCIARASDGKYLTESGSFDADITNADIWTGKPIFGQFKSWNKGFEAGESYRIYFSDVKEGTYNPEAMKIMNLVLLYDDATKATALTTPQVNDWNLGEGAEALMY